MLFKKIMYSAVSMVFCFLGVAFAYALLNSPLVAIIQILVYVGAISIVIIFAIMLTEVQSGRLELFFNRQTAVAAVAALLGAAILAAVALSANIGAISAESKAPGLRALCKLIFDRYVFPFELVSLVLVAAMIGAIVLATRERERP